MYSGQRLELVRQLPRATFPGLRVAVVDNYQGEENDIIVLSLVRSNKEGKLGFVKTQNRILVSLSRARRGLFVLGNLDMLTAHCEDWNAVLRELRALERETGKVLIGDAFTFRCRNHPDRVTLLKAPEDLKNCPEGYALTVNLILFTSSFKLEIFLCLH